MIDRKAQMMDAGTALFLTDEQFGGALGQVKAEMERYGKVLKATELGNVHLPDTTGECDLFLDYSTPWRNRYISCKVEDAGMEGGKHRYACILKEGNTSTPLRAAVHILLCVMIIAIHFIRSVWFPDSANFISSVSGILLILLILYLWMVPGKAAVKTARALKQRLEI